MKICKPSDFAGLYDTPEGKMFVRYLESIKEARSAALLSMDPEEPLRIATAQAEYKQARRLINLIKESGRIL